MYRFICMAYLYIYISSIIELLKSITKIWCATFHQLWYFDIDQTFILITRRTNILEIIDPYSMCASTHQTHTHTHTHNHKNRADHTFYTVKCGAWTHDKIVRLSFVVPYIQFKYFISFYYTIYQCEVLTAYTNSGRE